LKLEENIRQATPPRKRQCNPITLSKATQFMMREGHEAIHELRTAQATALEHVADAQRILGSLGTSMLGMQEAMRKVGQWEVHASVMMRELEVWDLDKVYRDIQKGKK
jgi:D-arabinose 1-dehydrogenase-like Zn-dependent alcohol dehydrogenase